MTLIRSIRKYHSTTSGAIVSDSHVAFGVPKETYDAILKIGIAQGKTLGYREGLRATQAFIQKQLRIKLAEVTVDAVKPPKLIADNVRDANSGVSNLERPIEDLDLPKRWRYMLWRAGIYLIGDIPAVEGVEPTLESIRGFGPKATDHVRAALASFDLKLPDQSLWPKP